VISARDINEKQFHDAWRGYNQEEVDDFLDRIAEAIDGLQRENDALKERLSELDQKLESSKTSEEMLKKTLESAQVAAQEAISTARSKADEIVRDAEERAERARDELKMRVETAAQQVRQRTEEIEREQEARRREIQESVDQLQEFEADLKRKLHSFLEQQAAALGVLDDRGRRGPALVAADEPDDDTFDAAVEELPDDPADSLIDLEDDRSFEPPTLDSSLLEPAVAEEDGDHEAQAVDRFDTSQEPSLEDFAPYDDDAFGPAPKKRRGLFRRDRDPEVSPEEV